MASTREFRTLMRQSRFAAMPRPLVRDADSRMNKSPYPTHQVLATPSASQHRGDWGLKRTIPGIRTKYLTVKQNDTWTHQTPWESAEGSVTQRQKFHEMGMTLDYIPPGSNSSFSTPFYSPARPLSPIGPEALRASARNSKTEVWKENMSPLQWKKYCRKLRRRRSDFLALHGYLAEATDAAETTEAADAAEATEAVEVAETAEAAEAREAREAAEAAEAAEAREAMKAAETAEATAAREAREAVEALNEDPFATEESESLDRKVEKFLGIDRFVEHSAIHPTVGLAYGPPGFMDNSLQGPLVETPILGRPLNGVRNAAQWKSNGTNVAVGGWVAQSSKTSIPRHVAHERVVESVYFFQNAHVTKDGAIKIQVVNESARKGDQDFLNIPTEGLGRLSMAAGDRFIGSRDGSGKPKENQTITQLLDVLASSPVKSSKPSFDSLWSSPSLSGRSGPRIVPRPGNAMYATDAEDVETKRREE
ncbi:hypothetical protein SAICODRAFT_72480 [Saitoella complicata NRRL Y-17804]|nr:uncharacterized protein SAICODRAFT_72480 [Saitoella complicata NRRL Y-17804]ODQ51522.1 hypothetical protein SAICODRAFT_72480 [Saitoella complicata NRRL Y-17804]